MFFFQEGFTYRNFLMDVLAIFIFIVWFWLLITVFSDLFRRHDISGWTDYGSGTGASLGPLPGVVRCAAGRRRR